MTCNFLERGHLVLIFSFRTLIEILNPRNLPTKEFCQFFLFSSNICLSILTPSLTIDANDFVHLWKLGCTLSSSFLFWLQQWSSSSDVSRSQYWHQRKAKQIGGKDQTREGLSLWKRGLRRSPFFLSCQRWFLEHRLFHIKRNYTRI